jgi:hypothetical protein
MERSEEVSWEERLGGLKHKPVYLLPYRDYDGPYAGDTDCIFLSVGWAQYDPRSLSVKTLRYVGDRWSRQSEELPLHRAIDAIILVAASVQATIPSNRPDPVHLPAGTFENQADDKEIVAGVSTNGRRTGPDSPVEFVTALRSRRIVERLEQLRAVLNRLHVVIEKGDNG